MSHSLGQEYLRLHSAHSAGKRSRQKTAKTFRKKLILLLPEEKSPPPLSQRTAPTDMQSLTSYYVRRRTPSDKSSSDKLQSPPLAGPAVAPWPPGTDEPWNKM